MSFIRKKKISDSFKIDIITKTYIKIWLKNVLIPFLAKVITLAIWWAILAICFLVFGHTIVKSVVLSTVAVISIIMFSAFSSF